MMVRVVAGVVLGAGVALALFGGREVAAKESTCWQPSPTQWDASLSTTRDGYARVMVKNNGTRRMNAEVCFDGPGKGCQQWGVRAGDERKFTATSKSHGSITVTVWGSDRSSGDFECNRSEFSSTRRL